MKELPIRKMSQNNESIDSSKTENRNWDLVCGFRVIEDPISGELQEEVFGPLGELLAARLLQS